MDTPMGHSTIGEMLPYFILLGVLFVLFLICFRIFKITSKLKREQAVSSVGGAIAGGVMFGPLGAIIGGRAKNKKVKTVTRYFIITYINDQEEIKYIGFDIQNNIMPACKLIEECQQFNINSSVQIEL